MKDVKISIYIYVYQKYALKDLRVKKDVRNYIGDRFEVDSDSICDSICDFIYMETNKFVDNIEDIFDGIDVDELIIDMDGIELDSYETSICEEDCHGLQAYTVPVTIPAKFFENIVLVEDF